MKDIIINKNEDGSNLIALVENGKLIEKYDEECSQLLLTLEKIKMLLYI